MSIAQQNLTEVKCNKFKKIKSDQVLWLVTGGHIYEMT